MSDDLPKIVSDEEFDRLIKEREKAQVALRSDHDRWDNSGVSPAQRPSDGRPESTIEQQFPQVAKKLTMVWPSEACAVYLGSLLVCDRETRRGFPPEVVDDLLMLHAMNEMLLRGTFRLTRPPPGIQ